MSSQTTSTAKPISMITGEEIDVQAIYRDPESGVYFGASESRKDGHAAGY